MTDISYLEFLGRVLKNPGIQMFHVQATVDIDNGYENIFTSQFVSSSDITFYDVDKEYISFLYTHKKTKYEFIIKFDFKQDSISKIIKENNVYTIEYKSSSFNYLTISILDDII